MSKYGKGTRTRESLSATELRADMKVREVAISRNDVRLLALTARNIVAAEADHYHPSCYRDYARPEKLGKIQSGLTKEDTKYQTCENS